jgi:UrcA family protein
MIPTALVLSAAIMAMPAVAAEAEPNSVRVEYKDLDLTTRTGQDELQRRLDRAARSVCGMNELKTGTRLHSADQNRCYRDARSSLDRHFAALIDKHAQGG